MLHLFAAAALLAGPTGPAPRTDPVPHSEPAPYTDAALPSLSESLAAPPPVEPLPPQGEYDYGIAPKGWISVGMSFFSSDIDVETVDDSENDPGISVELGLYGWQSEMGLGLELGLIHSKYDAVGGDSLLNPTEEVEVWRGMVGLRLADRGSGDRFLPWLHGGFLYRFDDSNGTSPQGGSLSDDGPGFYLGGGFDLMLIGGLALSPQVMYQQSSSVDSQEWIGTVSLTYLF